MQNRIWTVVTVVAVVLGIIGVIRLTRTGPVPVTAPAEDVCTEHDHGEPAAHLHDESGDHEHEAAPDLGMSEQEILEAQCEHGTLTHLCPDCRYGVGVVQVDESLMKDPGAGGGGLVGLRVASGTSTRRVLRVTGEVELNENAAVHISPRIPGIVLSVAVDVGARVRKGTVLFEIESTELGRALSEYEKNRAMKDLARRNYEREKALYERKISSEWDMIETQMVYEEYQTELKAAEAALRALGFRDEDIRNLGADNGTGRLGSLPTRAPFDGMIIDKHAVIGELVEPGTEMMVLADLAEVWVWADIYEQDLAVLIEAEGSGPIPVEVSVHAFPGRTFTGKIDYIGATMDQQTRTVKVRATIVNDDHLLRPGMFCEIRMLLASAEEALAIPKVSLLSDEGLDFVFKHLKDNLYVRRLVEKGREFDDSVEIVAGLLLGETVVTDGAFLLKSDVLRSKMGAG